MKKRVVITGAGVLTPVGNSVPETWSALLEGKSGIGPITVIDASKHDTRIAGEIKGFDPLEVLDKKEARRIPRFIQYALKAAKEALEYPQVLFGKARQFHVDDLQLAHKFEV